MAYLAYGIENIKIYHFDIKPDNILYYQGRYMIADFGTSYVILKIFKMKINLKKYFF